MFPMITGNCPFCGTSLVGDNPDSLRIVVKSDEIQGHNHCWCECTMCGSRGPVAASPVEAVEEWNRRIDFPKEAPEMETHG